MKTVYVYLQEGLADWEAGYAVAELHSGRFFKPSAAAARKNLRVCRGTDTTMAGWGIAGHYRRRNLPE